jgi:hypothetical protein
MHTFSRFARPYQRSRAAFSTFSVGNQIAESECLTAALPSQVTAKQIF